MNKLEKVAKYTKWVPFVMFITVNFFLALVFILGSQHYAYIRWQGWYYGNYVYRTTPYNFYSCAFTYDDTLVGFIFMVINANLITVADVSGMIQLFRKKLSLGNAIFNFVFSGLYFITGLVMAIFLATCCHIDTGIPMVVMGFFQTFLIFVPLAYGLFGIVAYILIKRSELKNKQEPAPAPVEEKKQPLGVEEGVWYCPECGTKNRCAFCSECGTKKPM